MDITFSAFSRPQRSTQQDYLFSNVSRCNMLAHVTGGLRSLYECIKFGGTRSSLANTRTDADGRFVPKHHMILANRYRIQSCIETSGQSAVLVEAKDCFRKMLPVVIKVMHTSYLAVGLKEVHTLRKINSADPREISHTIRLLNSFRLEDHICLVFPLLNPVSLTEVISDKFLHKDEVLQAVRKISLQLLSALAFLRSLNIIHADIKPENILLNKDGDINTVTLIDFGNAIHHIHSEVSLYYTDFELQTQPYRAPEVHLGNPFSVEVDMWSLGCVLLEMITGQLAFAASDRANSLKKMVSALGPLPTDMCKRGKFYSEVESVVVAYSSHKRESGALGLMFAFPCIKNYEFASFLSGLLTYHPDKRMTPWEALQHPFMAPLIYIPHFLTETGADVGADTGIIRKSDYHFKQNISSNVRRLYPSSLDLLRAGTSDQLLLGRSNVAMVEPLGMEDCLSRHENEKAFCVMQESVGVHILSPEKKKTYNRLAKHTLPIVQSRETIKPVKYRPVDQNKFVATESHVSANIVPNLDKCGLTHKYKRDQMNRTCEIFRSEPKNVVFQNGHCKNASPSHEPTSDYDTVTECSSHDDVLDVALMNHLHSSDCFFTTSSNLVTHEEPKLLKRNKNVAYHMSQLSETDDYSESVTIEAGLARASSQSAAYTGDHYNITSSRDITEKMCPVGRRDTSAFHQIREPFEKYKSSPRKKQHRSLVPVDQIFTHNELSQVLPSLDHPSRSDRKCMLRTAEKQSLAGLSNKTDSFLSRSVTGECNSSFNVERSSHKQNCSFQEHENMYKESSFQDAANEKSSMNNAIPCRTGMLSIDGSRAVMPEQTQTKQKHQQNLYIRSADLCSPCEDTDLDSFHHQIKLSEMDKQNSCLEKIGLVENNSCQTHGIIKTIFPGTRSVTIFPENLDGCREEVLFNSEDESTEVDKEGSLNTTQEYPAFDKKQLNNTTTVSSNTDNNNKVMFALPVIKNLKEGDNCSHIPSTDVNRYDSNCSHIPSTDVNRYDSNCSHVSSTDECMHVDKLGGSVKWNDSKVHIKRDVHDLSNTISISPFHKDTGKELPDTNNRNSSSKLQAVGNEVENDVGRQKGITDLPVIFKNEMENVREIIKTEPVVDLCDIMDEHCHHKCKDLSEVLQLFLSKMGENEVETTQETLLEKAKFHDMEKTHCLRNITELKQPEDRFEEQTYFQSECTKTPTTHKHKTRSRKLLFYTKQRASVFYCKDLSKTLQLFLSKMGENEVETTQETLLEKTKFHDMEKTHCLRNITELKVNTLEKQPQDCFEEQTLSECTKTPTTYKHKARSRKLLSFTKQRTSVFNTDKFNYSRPFRVFRPKLLKSLYIKRENNNKSSEHSSLCHTRKKGNKCRKESNLGASSSVISSKNCGFEKTIENNQKSKFRTLENMFSTEYQKKSESLQTDVSADQVTEEISHGQEADNLNSSHLDVSSPLKTRSSERDNMSTSDIGPILNENFRLCLAGKDLNHDLAGNVQPESQGMQQINLGVKSLNASRLLRAKSVKRALLFHTEKSPKFYAKKTSAKAGVRRSLWNSKFPTKELKAETGLAHSDETDDSHLTLSKFKPSGSFRKTNHNFLHLLSSSVNDHNSSDPYEFKVTPAKLQPATDNFVKAKRKGASRQRRSKPSVPVAKMNDIRKNLSFSSEIGATVTISDLVQMKSRHMFHNNNSSVIQDKVTPLNTLDFKNPIIDEENMKCSEQVTMKAKLVQNGQHNLIWDTTVPATEKKEKLSGHEYTRIKTSASREEHSDRISETVDSVLMSRRCFPSDKSKLATFASDLPPTLNSLLETAHVIGNKAVTNASSERSHCVTFNMPSNPPKYSYLEQTASRKRKIVQNIEEDELAVSQTLEDCESTNYQGSTFDFAHSSTLKSVAVCSVDEESEEEIMLLD